MGEIDKRTAVATHQLHDTDAVLCTLSLDMSSVDGPLGLLHGSVKSERLVDHLHARAVQDEEATIRNENDVLLFIYFFSKDAAGGAEDTAMSLSMVFGTPTTAHLRPRLRTS
jgi:hypothetical protein